jgi:hypothetical protein
MPENKRPVKRLKSFRLNWATFEFLARIVKLTGWSEASIVEIAITEYFRNHPEYWPQEKKEDIDL